MNKKKIVHFNSSFNELDEKTRSDLRRFDLFEEYHSLSETFPRRKTIR
jgi:hypothetical protein